jgi:predicted Zn finger-like uncharacterized protein
MFTVCPKCALTLVVTAQDLRVAQGYVRCGRCSNVFNAIVGLTDDRGALGSSQGTASTSIIRKAPSITDDAPAQDALNDTGESEAIYAEPDAEEVKFQEVFSEPSPPTRAPARTPPPAPVKKAPDAEKRYSDTEGIDTYSESELEFNPDVTDVTKVFVEAAPVTFKGDATGKFRKFVMGEEQDDPTDPATAQYSAASPSAPQAPPASNGATGGAKARGPTPPPSGNAAPDARSSAPGAQAPSGNTAASGAGPQGASTRAQPSGTGTFRAQPQSGATGTFRTQGAAGSTGTFRTPADRSSTGTYGTQPSSASGTASSTPSPPSKGAAPGSPPTRTPPAPPPPDRDDEDLEIDSQLRSLAERLDVTSSRPAAKFPAGAANDEAVQRESDENDGGSIGDIYAKAAPRPRPPPPAPPPPPPRSGTATRRSQPNTYADEDDDFAADLAPADADAEMQAVDNAIDTFTPAAPPRSRFMWWVAGAAVLSLGLVGQAIHHNRHSLATNALLNRPLTKFYKAIGVPLVPSWDLRSYDVRQLGASTNEGGDGTLTVRASLKNNSTQPLPLPLLRITMQDRYGNRIATRDVPPSGYAPGAVPVEAHLGVGQRIDAEMTFKDPGQNAVGFEIDACLATANGRIACANDQAPALR